jgi:hypothetical protein
MNYPGLETSKDLEQQYSIQKEPKFIKHGSAGDGF